MNLSDIYKKPIYMLGALALGLVLLILLNEPILQLSEAIQTPYISLPLAWISGVLYFVVTLFVLLYISFLGKNTGDTTATILWSAFLLAAGLSIALKFIFQIPRPEVDITVLKEFSYAFPSTHAATAFAFLPVVAYYKKQYTKHILYIAFFIAVSRIYLGVHFLTDVVIGGSLGYGIGHFVLYLQKRFAFFTRLVDILFHQLEGRRQIAHLLLGIVLVYLLEAHVLTPLVLGVMTLLGLPLCVITKTKKIPLVTRVLHFFERQHHIEKFPGRGVFYFFLGSFISTLLFPLHIAQAAILILAFGDSLTNVVGKHLGRFRLPYNPKKRIEGPIAGAIVSAFAASIFVPLDAAMLAAFIAMAVETLPLTIGKTEIDDNITIPVTACIVLTLLV